MFEKRTVREIEDNIQHSAEEVGNDLSGVSKISKVREMGISLYFYPLKIAIHRKSGKVERCRLTNKSEGRKRKREAVNNIKGNLTGGGWGRVPNLLSVYLNLLASGEAACRRNYFSKNVMSCKKYFTNEATDLSNILKDLR